MLISGIFVCVCAFLCVFLVGYFVCLFLFKREKEQSWVGRIWEVLGEEKCLIKVYLRKFVS